MPKGIRTAVRNNGGGYANHSLFWQIMTPAGGGEPSGVLADAINSAFGSFADFRETLFRSGGGRVWLRLGLAGG